MPPAGRGTGHAGIADMTCAGVQVSRQPSPAHPRGCVRLRGSTSRRRRKRSSPAPVRPRGLPLSFRAIGGLALRSETALALRLWSL